MNKICINCAHHHKVTVGSGMDFPLGEHVCHAFKREDVDLVTGARKTVGIMACAHAREFGQNCGIEGKLFKPKTS